MGIMDRAKKKNGDPHGGSNITVQHVLDSSPREDSSVTRVLNSIEQRDEEKGNLSAGILPDLPEEGAHVFRRHKNKVNPSTETTQGIEESLFFLTNQMSGGPDSVDHDDPNSNKIKSQAAKFVENAESLMEKSYLADLPKGEVQTCRRFREFLAFHHDSLWRFVKSALFYAVVPGLGLTCLLYYALGNPGGNGENDASVSWWINFVFVRNVLTLSLAKTIEIVFIDFFCLATTSSIKLVGPLVTLVLVQSKGWPFQLMVWGALDFAMLYGDSKFARHWFFYQDALEVFNANNKAGRVTEADSWENILISVVVIGAAVCAKRFFVSLWYGQGVYRQYAKDLAIIMNKAVLVGQVAALAKDKKALSHAQHFELDFDKLGQEHDADAVSSSKLLIQTDNIDLYSSGLSQSQKATIVDLLGEWEEPDIDDRKIEAVPISAIVQFRSAVSTIDNDYPFTLFFGLADKRESCINSSQRVFLRLETSENDSDANLKFDTIAVIALNKDGTMDEKKLKDLVGIFRPTRDGEITMLDFVKSIDTVYKDLRILRASIYNAERMSAASQKLVNVVFYFVLFWLVLGICDIDQGAFFAGIVGFIVGFAFMIGGASSKYFEGLLFCLVRKPFDIGDRVAVSGVEDEVSGSGSDGWIVKDLDLFKTTVVFGFTNEEATYSNGSLASSRIINHNRSPKASLHFYVRFGIDVEKDKVKTVENAVEQFVKDRPREWLSFGAFRLSNVYPDLGYVEYIVIMTHRESWQQIGAVLTSKAAVQLFAYELSKEMDMGYESPAMPIILSKRSNNERGESDDDLFERKMDC